MAGFDISREQAEVRRRGVPAFENLKLSATLYGTPSPEIKPRISEALEFMGLAASARKLVKECSGGIIRRLELAQAMIHRPRVLFLDEPTVGLDPLARCSVWGRLMELKEKYDMAILITTHDMEEANRLCDSLAMLHPGKMAALGTPACLKTSVGPHANLNDVFAHFSEGTRLPILSTLCRG